MFCPTKDKIPELQKANLIYKLTCPGCGKHYIGKTDRCLSIRLKEHGTREDQPMNLHLKNCHDYYQYISLFDLPSLFDDNLETIDYNEHLLNTVFDNYTIVDSSLSWSHLIFLEAYYIKQFSPEINCGLKASKELQLFS